MASAIFSKIAVKYFSSIFNLFSWILLVYIFFISFCKVSYFINLYPFSFVFCEINKNPYIILLKMIS